jgi:hypothetical protein
MTREEEHLAEAERYIAETEAQIARQQQLIAGLPASSGDVVLAETLLATLEQVLGACQEFRVWTGG